MLTPEERKLDMLGLAPKPAPKPRVKPLPPQRAACGVLMDGDRIGEHQAQCKFCVTVMMVPRTDDSGNMERIAKRVGHEMPAITPTHCGVCFQAGPTVAQRWCRRNAGGVKFQRTICDGCYLTEERAIFVSASGNLRPSGVLRDGARPALLDHRPPPLAHSMGIEDPALPNVWD